MFFDVVFPRENEKEFIKLASRLSYNGLFFVYKYDKNKDYEKKIKKLQKHTKLKLSYGFIISLKDTNKIKKTKALIFIKSSSKNRFVIEKNKANVLFALEEHTKEDFIHHRASGLNHVLCKLASKNKIIIGFSFNSILKSSKNSYKILGRIMQNIWLCRKYKIKTLTASFAEQPYEMRSVYDLISLFSVLGMDKEEVKNSFDIDSLIKSIHI